MTKTLTTATLDTVDYKIKTKKTMNKFLMAAVIITAIIVILSYFGGDDNEKGFQS